MTLYSTADGAETNSKRNVDYLKAIREGRTFNVRTGFRVWDDKSERDTDASGDAEAFTMTFTDFGIDDAFLVDHSSEDAACPGLAASAAIATALVSLLMF